MIQAGHERILILGIGNELLGDEGLGVHVARALQPGLPDWVRVLEAGTMLFDLLPEMPSYPHVILVDAIRMGRTPGMIYRVELDGAPDLREACQLSLHHCSLFEVLDSARILGLLPARLTLVGAEPERIEPTLELSPTLRRAAARIVSTLLTEVGASLVAQVS